VATPPAAGAAQPVLAGNLRGLAVASEKRMKLLPDVPTYAESGYPGFTASAWTGFFVPAKTPSDIAIKLNTAILETLKEPEVVARLEQIGFEPIYLDQPKSEAMFRAEIAKWRTMVEAIDLKVE
jgi:tripartite-type tricarboxylate transporter receptor subunit TctC